MKKSLFFSLPPSGKYWERWYMVRDGGVETNLSPDAVSSESHISFSTISIHLYFFVSLAPYHLSQCFPPRLTLPHASTPPPPISNFIQGRVSKKKKKNTKVSFESCQKSNYGICPTFKFTEKVLI